MPYYVEHEVMSKLLQVLMQITRITFNCRLYENNGCSHFVHHLVFLEPRVMTSEEFCVSMERRSPEHLSLVTYQSQGCNTMKHTLPLLSILL